MRKPKRLTALDLAHPNATHYKAPNGDIRPKPNHSRFNHSSNLEDTGAFSRRDEQGLTTIDGTAAPSRTVLKAGRLQQAKPSELDKRNRGSISPVDTTLTMDVAMKQDLKPITNNKPEVINIYSPYSKPTAAQRRQMDAPVVPEKTERQRRITRKK